MCVCVRERVSVCDKTRHVVLWADSTLLISISNLATMGNQLLCTLHDYLICLSYWASNICGVCATSRFDRYTSCRTTDWRVASCEWLSVPHSTVPLRLPLSQFAGIQVVLLHSPHSFPQTSVVYWSLVMVALLLLAYQQWHCSLPLFLMTCNEIWSYD